MYKTLHNLQPYLVDYLRKQAIRACSFKPPGTPLTGQFYEAARWYAQRNQKFRAFVGLPPGQVTTYQRHDIHPVGRKLTAKEEKYRLEQKSLFGEWTRSLPVEQGGGDAWRDQRALEAVKAYARERVARHRDAVIKRHQEKLAAKAKAYKHIQRGKRGYGPRKEFSPAVLKRMEADVLQRAAQHAEWAAAAARVGAPPPVILTIDGPDPELGLEEVFDDEQE